MSDTKLNAFREEAQKLTRLRIDGVDVNPDEVKVDVTAHLANSVSHFRIEIGCVALFRELQQAGVQILLTELSEFVQKDLDAHPQEALSGYLRIVRGIVGFESPKKRWRLSAKSEPAAMLRWSVGRAEQVISDGDRLTILGGANRIVI